MLICALFFILLPWESANHSVTTFFVNTANKALFPLQDALLGFPAEYSEVKTSWNRLKWVLKQVHFFFLIFSVFSTWLCSFYVFSDIALLHYQSSATLLCNHMTMLCKERQAMRGMEHKGPQLMPMWFTETSMLCRHISNGLSRINSNMTILARESIFQCPLLGACWRKHWKIKGSGSCKQQNIY